MDDNFKRFRGIHLDVLNDSGFTFTPSKANLPVLDGVILDFEGTKDDSIRDVFPGQRRSRLCTLSLPDDAPISDAGGLLTFDFGSPDLKVVVWVRFSPDKNAAGIKFGLLPAAQVVDGNLLQKLTPEVVEDEKSGFSESKVSSVSIEGKTKTLGVGTMLDVEEIDVDRLNDYWDLDRKPTAIIWACDFVEHPEWKKTANSNLKHFEIAGGKFHMMKQPVHENLTIAALVQAGCCETDQSETYEGIAEPFRFFSGQPNTINWAQHQFEYIRGVVWNDDPLCALFDNSKEENSVYALGAEWYLQFDPDALSALIKVDIDREKNLIQRSHYGNLQFLHSMACNKDEPAGETKRKIMIWLEVMYTLAAQNGSDGIDATGRMQLKQTKLKEFFDDTTQPPGTATLRDLLMGTTPSYERPRLERRALGSCFHVIQDSYAVGHCKRELLNSNEKIEIPITKTFSLGPLGEIGKVVGHKAGFPQGKWGEFGKIDHFHCYKGQDKDEHGKYDTFQGFDPKANDPSTFNVVLGGRNAIAACAQLAKFASEHREWEGSGGVKEWLAAKIFLLVNDNNMPTTDVEV